MPKEKSAKKAKVKATTAGPAQPTAADADIALKLYDMRREPVMRQSREILLRWFPESFDDVAAYADFGHEHNAAFRQVTSYFEMAYGLARRGAVHPEVLMEWCGEGVFLFAKLHPFLAEFRERVSGSAFANTEWAVKNTEVGRAKFEQHSARLAARGS